jgi:hypothetical protein
MAETKRRRLKKSSSKQHDGHGGFRKGAGRKPDLLKRMVASLKPATAAELLASVDAEKVIKDIFSKGSLALRQKALTDLLDRVYGKPTESVQIHGHLAHWTPGLLAHLSDAEVAVLSKLTRPPALPGQPSQSH